MESGEWRNAFAPHLSSEENAMKIRTVILASMALCVSGVSSAISGPCKTEIDGLTKTIAAKDAGSGPTIGATGRTQAPTGSSAQHPPTAVMGQETQGKATSPEDVRRQTQGQPTAAQQGNAGTPGATQPTRLTASRFSSEKNVFPSETRRPRSRTQGIQSG